MHGMRPLQRKKLNKIDKVFDKVHTFISKHVAYRAIYVVVQLFKYNRALRFRQN